MTNVVRNGAENQAILEAALGYARRGLPVVHIKPKDKKPIGNDWQRRATSDPDTLQLLWQFALDANVGIQMGRGDEPIIDIECDSPEAEEEYQALWNGNPPAVPTYRGLRGRHHLYHWREGFPDKAVFHYGALEVRTGNGGKGAQSVFPPSIHPSGAVYSWEPGLSLDDVSLGSLPDEIVTKLVTAASVSDDQHDDTSEPDLEHAEAIKSVSTPHADRLKAYRRHLAASPGAVQGRNADGYCYALAVAGCWDYALPEDDVENELYDWGQKDGQQHDDGTPYPWTWREIRHKVRDAARRGSPETYVGNAVWDREARQVQEIVTGGELPALSGNGQSPPKPPRVVLERWSRTKAIARQQQEDWLIKGWAEFGCLHAVTGLPFSGKSSIIADILAAMVRGEPWCEMPVKPVPFVLLDLENKERILVKRLQRALEGNEGRMEELYSRINPCNLPEVPIPVKFVVECIEAVGAPKGFIIIDTMRTAFQKDSNDETAMLALLTPLKLIAHRTGWCIIVLHHNAKVSNRYSGSTAFAGVLDYLWNWTRDGYTAELSLEGRDDAVEPLCFEFDMDEQRNIFQGTKGETAAADRQERSNLDLCEVLRHLPDSPNGLTVAEVMALSGVKKWRCRDLLTKKAVNAKYAVKVGMGSIGSPSTYYRTQAGKALVDKIGAKSLVG